MPWPRRLIYLAAYLLVTLGAGCSSQTQTPAFVVVTNTRPPTREVAAVTTTSTPTIPAPTRTPRPPTETPSPTPEPPCTNDSEFVADVTVPDGMQLLPGQRIVKKWSIRNAGRCHWGADYRFVLVSGNAMGTRSEVALYPARAGATATIEIPMVSPPEPGSYTSRWQARDPNGNLFGDVVFIKIEVIPLPGSETATPPPP